MIVAIDGPAGAGKSTVARALAERLGCRYLDTGAMYRAVAWLALERGVDPADGVAVTELARANPVELEVGGRVAIAGTDVTHAIRAREIDLAVPSVARHTSLREVMRERQRALAEEGDAVIEGRDIGRIVVPRAEVKIFLVADPSVRAERRAAERGGAGDTAEAMRARDASDAVNMEPAPDAIELDTTSLTIDQVVDRVERLARAAEAA